MKEIEIKQKDNLEVSIKQKKVIDKQFIGNIVPHEGHKMWSINKETLEIKQAEYIGGKHYIWNQENRKEILITEGFAHVSALNKKNALKLYKKNKTGGVETISEPLKLI